MDDLCLLFILMTVLLVLVNAGSKPRSEPFRCHPPLGVAEASDEDDRRHREAMRRNQEYEAWRKWMETYNWGHVFDPMHLRCRGCGMSESEFHYRSPWNREPCAKCSYINPLWE